MEIFSSMSNLKCHSQCDTTIYYTVRGQSVGLLKRRTWKFLGTVKRLQQKFYAACSLVGALNVHR